MVTSCSASGCTNRHQKGTSKGFHGFPLNNPELLKKWIIATKRKNFVPSSNSKLCSDHFTAKDYSDVGHKSKGKWLKSDAVPSIFPNPEPKVKKQKRTKRSAANPKKLKDYITDKHQDDVGASEDLKSSISPELPTSNHSTVLQGTIQKSISANTPENYESIEDIEKYPNSPSENVVSSSTSIPTSNDPKVTQKQSQSAAPSITSESHSSIADQACTSSHTQYSPAARQRIMGLKKSIKNLNQKIRRHKKKITSLENLVNKLKTRKSRDDQLERLLHQFSDNESFLEILKNMIKNHTKKSARFSYGMRKFAEALYAKSPKAYLFCKPILKLPSRKMVQIWISKTMNDYFNIIDGVVTGTKRKESNSPTKERTSSTQQQISPIQNEESPIQHQNSPIQSQTSFSPIQNENSFILSQNSPIQNTNSFILNQNSPVQEQTSPIQNTNSFIQNQNSPLQEQFSPIQKQTPPSLDQGSSIEELTSSILQEFEKDKVGGQESSILQDFENDLEDSLYVLQELEDIAVQDLPLQEVEQAPNNPPPQQGPEQVELHILTDDQYFQGGEQQTIALPVTADGNLKLGVPVTILHCGKLITAYPFA